MTDSARLSRRLARGLALALCFALAPVPAFAGETPRPAPSDPPKLAAAMTKVVDRDLAARTRTSEARRARQQTNPAAESTAFFKTKTGVLVLAVMAIGTGYAIYSTQNDRITSPGKE